MALEQMLDGIKLALEKCEEHLVDAEVLITRGSLNNAVVLIEFAIEEFGRAVYLKKKFKEGSVDVEAKIFKDHEYKYNMAWYVLPEELKTIYEGTFDVSDFDATDFDVGRETISPKTRLDATFVNYDMISKKWRKGVRADSETLKSIIKAIREKLQSFRIDDCSTDSS
jgi:AbiV family abortive infection protein